MLAAPEGVEILAGNRVPKRGEPLAMAYAGHRQSDPRTGCVCGACDCWPTSTFVLAEFVFREFMEHWVIGADADVGCACSGQRR
jgi:hypothetical protein